ncbi:MAG TPA: TRAP transporter small permease subunit [Burkholderiales bacterium]|nr:TRAP transporter small permease subunit [Burkholderiales bacterium]
MADAAPNERAGPGGLARHFVEWWALAGGMVLLAVAIMTTWSAFSGWVFGKPLSGDFELTELLVAIGVFAFLPYCQLSDANVTADLFTAKAGPRALAGFRLFAALLATAIAALLAWRTYAGLLDYQKYVETTAILKIPIWWAYVPALASLVLLVLACLIVLKDAVRDVVRG